MKHQPRGPVAAPQRVRGSGGVLVLEDRSCGACPACHAGLPVWCAQPGVVRSARVLRIPEDAAGGCLGAVRAGSAALRAGVENACVVVHEPGLASAAVVAALGAREVFLVTEDRHVHKHGVRVGSEAKVREWLAEATPTGRADVVLTGGGELRRAIRAVARGGCIATPGDSVEAITVTELVQRELGLCGPGDLLAPFATPYGENVTRVIESVLEEP